MPSRLLNLSTTLHMVRRFTLHLLVHVVIILVSSLLSNFMMKLLLLLKVKLFLPAGNTWWQTRVLLLFSGD